MPIVTVPVISLYNDLAFVAKLFNVNVTTGERDPKLTGVVRAWITSDPDPQTGPVRDPALTVDVPKITNGDPEDWLVSFPGNILTFVKIDGLAQHWVVVESVDTQSIRVALKLAYKRTSVVTASR
jgi:hypothetical protein